MTASALLSSTAPAEVVPFDGTEAPACAAPLVQDSDSDTITTLEGQELLDFLAANPGLKESEAIKATGHYKLIDGKPRLNRARYYKAISAANGFAPAKPERKPRGETGPRGVLKVGPGGLIPVGAAYSRLLGLTPGTFVSVYKDEGVLVIEPGTDEAVAAAEAEAAKAPAAEAPKAEPKAKAKKA